MKLSELLDNLDISTLGLIWAKITGGWKGIAVYLCKALTALLKKAPPEDLGKYASVIRKVMELVSKIVDDFVCDGYKEAGLKTVQAIDTLVKHIEDGQYDEAELNEDIDSITACIEAWRNAGK